MFESCFGFPKTFDDEGRHASISKGGKVKPRSNCGQCDLLEGCMAKQATFELLDSHPCLGKLCGSTAFPIECESCELLERCKKISQVLNYTGIYLCPFCGTISTVLHSQIELKYDEDDSSFQAIVKCYNCEYCTEAVDFSGKEQQNIDLFLNHPLCKCYPSVYSKLWNANRGAKGTHEKPWIVPIDCGSRCKPKRVMECLGSIAYEFKRNRASCTIIPKPKQEPVVPTTQIECVNYKDFNKLFTPELGEPKKCFLCTKIFGCLKKFMESVGTDLVSPLEVTVECEQYPIVDDEEDEACEGCSCVEFCEDSFRNEFVHPSDPDQCRYFFEFRYFGNDKVLMAKQCAKCSFTAHCKEKCIIKNEIRTRMIRDTQNFL
jgi:hypothetical protein